MQWCSAHACARARPLGGDRALATIAAHDAAVPLFYFHAFHIVHTPLQGAPHASDGVLAADACTPSCPRARRARALPLQSHTRLQQQRRHSRPLAAPHASRAAAEPPPSCGQCRTRTLSASRA
jgi:hypothetical protein